MQRLYLGGKLVADDDVGIAGAEEDAADPCAGGIHIPYVMETQNYQSFHFKMLLPFTSSQCFSFPTVSLASKLPPKYLPGKLP